MSSSRSIGKPLLSGDAGSRRCMPKIAKLQHCNVGEDPEVFWAGLPEGEAPNYVDPVEHSAELQAFYELCQAGPPPPPPSLPRREYGARTCGYMDGIHTCSASAVQHRSVPSLDACKELCDSERGCSFVMVK